MLGEAKAQSAIDALDDTEFMGTHIQVQVMIPTLVWCG